MIDAKRIEAEIVCECNKLIARFHAYHNRLHNDWKRRIKTTGVIRPKLILTPDYWSKDRKFNPFYCKGNAKAIARSIARKIADGVYKPNPPHEKKIPKPNGGSRTLRIYEIPDAAVSRLVYSRLLAKNKHRFSSFAYAYRDDRNVQYAIQDLAAHLDQFERIFIAEFDFSDFFGNVEHTFLLSELKKNGLLISDADHSIIRAFLNPEKGFPQGTSISLFLANVACLSLDRELEQLGVKFARYADDTVICTPSYEAACNAANVLFNFSRTSGVKVNFGKSAGVHLLSQDHSHENKPELKSKEYFDFLGYGIWNHKLSIKEKSLERIKKEISFILYKNLVQPLKVAKLKGIVIPSGGKDEGLLTAMMQIRRYICGGMYKWPMTQYASGFGGQLHFKGLMSFYPLVTDDDQLKDLDGWLVATIFRSLKLRADLLRGHGYTRHRMFPFNVEQENIVRRFDREKIYGKPLLEVPSFVVVASAMRHALREHGIHFVMNPLSNKYGYRNS